MAKTTKPEDKTETGAGESGTTPDTVASTPIIPSRVMYLGPSFAMKDVLFQHGQIFNNGVPVTWLERIAIEPEFKLLLVPIEKVGKVMAELNDKDSAYSLAAAKVKATNETLRSSKRS